MDDATEKTVKYGALGFGLWGAMTITQDMFEHADTLAEKYLYCINSAQCALNANSIMSSYYFMASSIFFLFIFFGIIAFILVKNLFGTERPKAAIVTLLCFLFVAALYGFFRYQQAYVLAGTHNIGSFFSGDIPPVDLIKSGGN